MNLKPHLGLALTCAASLLAPTMWTSSSRGASPRVRILGKSTLDARAYGDGHPVRIKGRLVDENHTPLGDSNIGITWAGVPLWESVSECGQASRPGPERVAQVSVTTAADGSFCVEATAAGTSSEIKLAYAGTSDLPGTETVVTWDRRQDVAFLAFRDIPHRIDVCGASTLVEATVRDSEGIGLDQVSLELRDERSVVLARGTTSNGGDIGWQIEGSSFAPPGFGQLSLVEVGGERKAGSEVSAKLTRIGRVQLQAQTQDAVVDFRGHGQLTVRASTCRGLVSSGWVEATLGGVRAGTGRVVDGLALISLEASGLRYGLGDKLGLRYIEDSPAYLAGATTEISIRITPAPVWLRAAPILAGVLVLGWLLRGWWRPARTTTARKREVVGQPQAEWKVVRPSPSATTWTGVVLDAHEGTPVQGATVSIMMPDFASLRVLVSVQTSDDGNFELNHVGKERPLRLRVESRWHRTVERPLPSPSEIHIGLVTRRRQLLSDFANWAAGRRVIAVGEPTPGDAEQWARREPTGRQNVQTWAQQLQSTVFGPGPVDQESEERVQQLEPRSEALR